MKLKLWSISAVIMAFMTSCAVNDEGEVEVTWLFWFILAIIVLIFVSSAMYSASEAHERGISREQLLEEKKQALEKKAMRDGLKVDYLGGCPKWVNPCSVVFSIRGTSIVLKRNDDTITIPKEDIVAISNEKGGSRSVGKAVTGAIVGGVLTGGIGVLVGGALGARKKDTSEVYITYKYNGVELTLNLRPGKNTDKVYSWINSMFA